MRLRRNYTACPRYFNTRLTGEPVSDFVLVPLSGKRGQGQFAIIDAEFAEAILSRSWSLTVFGYACNTKRRNDGGRVTYTPHRLHRVVLHLAQGLPVTGRDILVDHVNRNKLDNRLINLRLTDRTGNNANREIQANNTSGRKGVSWDKESGKWRATIRYHGRLMSLGRFSDLDEAARAYDAKASELFGEYAVLNFPM